MVLSQLSWFPGNCCREIGDGPAAVAKSIPTKKSDVAAKACFSCRTGGVSGRCLSFLCDRLERLRKVVPHAERANTATFLEQVLTYIEALKKQISDLESQVQNKSVTMSSDTDAHRGDSDPVDGDGERGLDKGAGSVSGVRTASQAGTHGSDDGLCERGETKGGDVGVGRDRGVGILDSCPGTPPTAPLIESGGQQAVTGQGGDGCLKRLLSPEGGQQAENKVRRLAESRIGRSAKQRWGRIWKQNRAASVTAVIAELQCECVCA